jgi:uncharacterized protein (TIGR00369 family)
LSSSPLNTRWLEGSESGIAKLLGFRMTLREPDHTIIEFDAGPEHANPMGTLHGGVFCDLADAAMGTAWVTGLKDGETCTTIELKINFFRPVWSGRLIAEGRVLRRGKSVGYVECELRDTEGRLVAKASSTLMTLRGDTAAGR